MPFCPECRYEYGADVARCPDCDVDLVAHMPDDDDLLDQESKYKDWVQLARLNSHEFAHMIVEAFRAKDIPVVLLSGAGHFGQTGQMGVTSRAVGGAFSINVPKEFVIQADQEGEGILGEEWQASRLVDIESDDGPGPS
ncbi:MAG: hypothetical protein ABIE70_08090 [bacterium]